MNTKNQKIFALCRKQGGGLIKKLNIKGIKKFIAYKISENMVKEKYGKHYDVIMGDLHQTDDL